MLVLSLTDICGNRNCIPTHKQKLRPNARALKDQIVSYFCQRQQIENATVPYDEEGTTAPEAKQGATNSRLFHVYSPTLGNDRIQALEITHSEASNLTEVRREFSKKLLEVVTSGVVDKRLKLVEITDNRHPIKLSTPINEKCYTVHYSCDESIPANHKTEIIFGEFVGEVILNETQNETSLIEDTDGKRNLSNSMILNLNREVLEDLHLSVESGSCYVRQDNVSPSLNVALRLSPSKAIDERYCEVQHNQRNLVDECMARNKGDSGNTPRDVEMRSTILEDQSTRCYTGEELYEASDMNSLGFFSPSRNRKSAIKFPIPSVGNLLIDASKYCGILTFINHFETVPICADKNFQPNCLWHNVYVNGWPHIVLTSIPGVAIIQGDELFADFGSSWFSVVQERCVKTLRKELIKTRMKLDTGFSIETPLRLNTTVDRSRKYESCEICRQSEMFPADDLKMVICDGCYRLYHFKCLRLPDGFSPPDTQEWFCFQCERLVRRILPVEESKCGNSMYTQKRALGSKTTLSIASAGQTQSCPVAHNFDAFGILGSNACLRGDERPLTDLKPCIRCYNSRRHGDVHIGCRIHKGHLDRDYDSRWEIPVETRARHIIKSISDALIESEGRNLRIIRKNNKLKISLAKHLAKIQFALNTSLTVGKKVDESVVDNVNHLDYHSSEKDKAQDPSCKATPNKGASVEESKEQRLICDEIPIMVVTPLETEVNLRLFSSSGLVTDTQKARIEGFDSTNGTFIVSLDDDSAFEVPANRLLKGLLKDISSGQMDFRMLLPKSVGWKGYSVRPVDVGIIDYRRNEMGSVPHSRKVGQYENVRRLKKTVTGLNQKPRSVQQTGGTCLPHRGGSSGVARLHEKLDTDPGNSGKGASEGLAVKNNECMANEEDSDELDAFADFDEDESSDTSFSYDARIKKTNVKRAKWGRSVERRRTTVASATENKYDDGPTSSSRIERCSNGSEAGASGEAPNCNGSVYERLRARRNSEARVLKPWMRGVAWNDKRQAWITKYWTESRNVACIAIHPSDFGGVEGSYTEAVSYRVSSYQQMIQREAETLPAVTGIRWVPNQAKWNAQYRDKKTSFGALKSGAKLSWHKAWAWLNLQRKECGEEELDLLDVPTVTTDPDINACDLFDLKSASSNKKKHKAHPLGLEGSTDVAIDDKEILALREFTSAGHTNGCDDFVVPTSHAPSPCSKSSRGDVNLLTHSGRSNLSEAHINAAADEANALLPFPAGIIWARTTARFFALYKDEVTRKKRFKTFDPRKYEGSVKSALKEASDFLHTVEPWVGARRDNSNVHVRQRTPELDSESPYLSPLADNDMSPETSDYMASGQPLKLPRIRHSSTILSSGHSYYSSDPAEALRQMEAEVFALPHSGFVKWYRSKKGFSATCYGKTKWFSAFSRSVPTAYTLANEWVVRQQELCGAEPTALRIVQQIQQINSKKTESFASCATARSRNHVEKLCALSLSDSKEQSFIAAKNKGRKKRVHEDEDLLTSVPALNKRRNSTGGLLMQTEETDDAKDLDDFDNNSEDSEVTYDVQARRLPRIPNVCWVPQKQAFSVFYYKRGTKTTKAFNPLHCGGVKRAYRAASLFCKQMRNFLTKPPNDGNGQRSQATNSGSEAHNKHSEFMKGTVSPCTSPDSLFVPSLKNEDDLESEAAGTEDCEMNDEFVKLLSRNKENVCSGNLRGSVTKNGGIISSFLEKNNCLHDEASVDGEY